MRFETATAFARNASNLYLASEVAVKFLLSFLSSPYLSGSLSFNHIPRCTVARRLWSVPISDMTGISNSSAVRGMTLCRYRWRALISPLFSRATSWTFLPSETNLLSETDLPSETDDLHHPIVPFSWNLNRANFLECKWRTIIKGLHKPRSVKRNKFLGYMISRSVSQNCTAKPF